MNTRLMNSGKEGANLDAKTRTLTEENERLQDEINEKDKQMRE